MPKVIRSYKAGKDGRLGLGCSAFILDTTGKKVLLVRRSDNSRWAVPGGYIESGESLHEACEREVYEEAGIKVKATHLIAAYSDPNLLLKYPDGNKWQLVVLHFEAQFINGGLSASDETTEVGYFSFDQIKEMNLGDFDRQRVADGFAFQGHTFIQDTIGLT